MRSPVASPAGLITFTTKKFFFLSFIFYLHFSTKNSEYTKKVKLFGGTSTSTTNNHPLFLKNFIAFWTFAGLHFSPSAKVLMGGICSPVHTYLLKQLLLSQILFVNIHLTFLFFLPRINFQYAEYGITVANRR